MTSPDIETIPKPTPWKDNWRFMPGANRAQKRATAKAVRKVAVENRRNHPPVEVDEDALAAANAELAALEADGFIVDEAADMPVLALAV